MADDSKLAEVAPPGPMNPSSAALVSHAVGPSWHTIVLILLLIGSSWLGAHSQGRAAAKIGRASFYCATMIWEWLLLGFVWIGLKLRRVRLRDIIGGRWATVESVLLDFALAFGFWIVAAIVLSLLGLAVGIEHGKGALEDVRRQLGFIIPRTNLELTFFLLLSVTAGFCEEVIFRGYLQRQFIALSRSAWAGIIIAGLVFGASHAYEGSKRMVVIAVFGMMFGVLAHLRKSLRPGMIAHAWHDAFAGLLMRVLLK